MEEKPRQGKDDPEQAEEKPVELRAQRRAHEVAAPCLGDDAARVAEAPHRRHPAPAGAGPHRAARENCVPRMFEHGTRLARDEGLVHLQRAGLEHPHVHHGLVPTRQLDHIVEDDPVRRHADPLPVPEHPACGGGDDRQAVEGALGAQLLDQGDEDVENQDRAEGRVLEGPHQQAHGEQPGEERVHRCEDVVAHDVAVSPPGGDRDVDPPARHPRGDIGRPQSAGARRRARRGYVSRRGRRRACARRWAPPAGDAAPPPGSPRCAHPSAELRMSR